MAEPEKQDTWRYRRQAVRGTLAFCAVAIAYLIRCGNDGLLHVTAMEGLLWLAGAVVLIYVAGPLAEDIMRARAGLPPRQSAPKEG